MPMSQREANSVSNASFVPTAFSLGTAPVYPAANAYKLGVGFTLNAATPATRSSTKFGTLVLEQWALHALIKDHNALFGRWAALVL